MLFLDLDGRWLEAMIDIPARNDGPIAGDGLLRAGGGYRLLLRYREAVGRRAARCVEDPRPAGGASAGQAAGALDPFAVADRRRADLSHLHALVYSKLGDTWTLRRESDEVSVSVRGRVRLSAAEGIRAAV